MANFSLKQNEYRPENIFPVLIDSNLISVLRQTRTSMNYNDLEDLKSSIKKRGQKTPGDVYAFPKLGAMQYLNCINTLWNTSYDLMNFESHFVPEKEESFYFFLVAGHRRLRAVTELGLLYFANVSFQKTFEEAIEWQLGENFHEPISLLDLITAANYLWIMLKDINPKLTLKEFAKNFIHKSTSWLTDALKFMRLPLSVQELIKKTEISKGAPYVMLLEFVKLYDFSVEKGKPIPDDELVILVQHCLANQYPLKKVKEFCKLQEEKITGLPEIFSLNLQQVKSDTLSSVRRKRTIMMMGAEQYLNASPAIVKEITKTAKTKASNVITSGNKLGEILPSE